MGRDYLKLFSDNIRKQRYICDCIETLQIETVYTRDRIEQARITEVLFNAAVNGGGGDGRY